MTTKLAARRFRLASPATATTLGALAVALDAVAIPLAQLTVLDVGSDLLNLVFAGVGVLVARRQPRNPIGWILLIFIVLAQLGDDAGAYAVLAYSHGHRGLPLAPVAVLLAPLGYLAIPVFPLIIVLFPDGRLSLDPPADFRQRLDGSACRWSDLGSEFGRGFSAAHRLCGLSGNSGSGSGPGWPSGAVEGCCGRVWAGQAAAAGGPQAASNKVIHCGSRCQPSGRCSVMWPRPCRAVRAATSIRSRRSVAPRALP
jgi:hypothetical protein